MSLEWGTCTGALARNSITTGTVFGKLIVLHEVPHKRPGARCWLCRCECGTIKIIKSGNLKNNSTRSCGCWERNHARKRPYEWLYNRFLRTARTSGWETDVTFAKFLEYTQIARCHYCEKLVNWAPYASVNREHKTSGYNLDRKDTNVGYLTANIVVCCTICNYSKGDRFTYEQWLKVGQVLKTFA